MPTDIFAITAKESTTKLDRATRKGKLVFAVANTLERSVKARVSASGDPGVSAKLGVQPEVATLDPHETKEFAIAIEAPAEAKPGSYGVKLRVVDDDAPDDYSSLGPVAKYEVLAPENGKRPRVWPWLLLAAAVVLVLVIAAVLLIDGSEGRSLHEPCAIDDPQQACAEGLECFPLTESSLECRRPPEAKCVNDSECTSFWCREGRCSRDDGKCAGDDDCRTDAWQCTQPAGVCRKKNGQACADPAVCASGNCVSGACAAPTSPCAPPCPRGQFCIVLRGTPRCTELRMEPFMFRRELLEPIRIPVEP